MKFELASCIVIPTGNTIEEVLAVSRRNDYTKWGIPGGKRDAGESSAFCACREIEEELGLIFIASDLIPLYSGPCYGADGRNFWVTTYLTEINYIQPLKVEDGLKVEPKEMLWLCNETNSPFAHYNQQVISAWRKLM